MYLYEKSITDDINRLFTNSKVKAIVANSLNDGLKNIAAEKEDKITLPVIVLVGGNWTLQDTNFYNLMHGGNYKKLEDDSLSKNVNIIPFTPEYEMNIIASSSRECDMLTREILFHYFTNPTLVVDIPYKIDRIHTFNLEFGRQVRKNQTISGFIYRTLTFNLQGAYLWQNSTYELIKETDTNVESKIENNQN